MSKTKFILVFGFSSIFFCCNRIKRQGHEAIDKAQEKIIEAKQRIRHKRDLLIDKVFPTYDNGVPDTENNKKRFKEHLQVDLSSDVKNIYAYGDFIGIDYKVLISFTCDSTTIENIISVKKMQAADSKDDNGLGFLDEFKWWNKSKIELLIPYKDGTRGEYWEYLWYDKESKAAYYEEFSL